MAYFDDPAHKAQWEKELAALREEKQRRMNSGTAGGKKQQPDAEKLPTFEELVQQAALRHQNRELRKRRAWSWLSQRRSVRIRNRVSRRRLPAVS